MKIILFTSLLFPFSLFAATLGQAVAVMQPLGGTKIEGTVIMKSTKTGVQIVADLKGLAPKSVHGIHIHEFGDCRKPDGTSAGDHFNPLKKEHGEPNQGHHAGDLGNIVALEDGTVHYEVLIKGLSVSEGTNSVLGHALIVHADSDDFKTQPTGKSGARIACGVIGLTKP